MLAKPEAESTAGGALEPAVATGPYCPPGLPFKAMKYCLGGGKTQIRHGPGNSKSGCGLVHGVRGAGNSNQTGPSGQPPAGRLPDSALGPTMAPALWLGLHFLPRGL